MGRSLEGSGPRGPEALRLNGCPVGIRDTAMTLATTLPAPAKAAATKPHSKSMIRPTTTDDVFALLALTDATGFFKPQEVATLREVFADYFAKEQAAGHCCVTLEEPGQLLGFAYYAPNSMADRTWELWWIVVRLDLKGRGAGATLLDFLEADIRKHCGRILFVETSSQPRYEPTRRFYLKHHYHPHAVIEDFYATGDNKIVFRKPFE
jgi:ribosomal protein S18 acetylase RimI-like enzyme